MAERMTDVELAGIRDQVNGRWGDDGLSPGTAALLLAETERAREREATLAEHAAKERDAALAEVEHWKAVVEAQAADADAKESKHDAMRSALLETRFLLLAWADGRNTPEHLREQLRAHTRKLNALGVLT